MRRDVHIEDFASFASESGDDSQDFEDVVVSEQIRRVDRDEVNGVMDERE